jgi:hypothetical protein
MKRRRLKPEHDQIDQGVAEFKRLWDRLSDLPSYSKLTQGSDTKKLRNFSPSGHGHMLFRPVGQEALADALGVLVGDRKENLEVIVGRLRKMDAEGGFQLDSPKSAWWNILYDPSKKRMTIKGRKLAERPLVHILGGGTADHEQREKLRADFAEARTIEEQSMMLGGEWTKSPNQVQLPDPILV